VKRVLIGGLVVVMFSCVFFVVCHAQIEVPGIVEAEDQALEHTGGMGNIPGWWAFWANASLTVKCNVKEKGLYKVAVQSAGTPALDPDTEEKWPKMVVEIDGGDAGSFEWEVKEDMGKPKVYFTDAFTLNRGEHIISISFINDYAAAASDRNLFIDWIGIGPVKNQEDKPVLTLGEKLLKEDRESVLPDWTFDKEKNLQGWKVWQDAKIDAAEGALKIVAAGKEPLILSPRIEIKNIADFAWVSFIMKVDKGTKGEIRWMREGEPGMERRVFDLIADEQFHVYAINISSAPKWDKRVIAIALRPSDANGARAELKSVRIAEKPKGPAEMKVMYFGLEEAINRAGQDADLICVLENIGGEPGEEINLSVLLPAGVQVMEGERTTKKIKVLEKKEEIRWFIQGPNPIQDIARLEITGKNFTPVSASAVLSFTAKISVSPGIVEGKPYVPEPKPAKSNYLVGAYYFPGWKQGAHKGWAAIKNFPERKPVLGWYQEGEPDIADWHIKWAVEHGISFFAYDWYWDRGARQLDHALNNGYLKSRYRKYLMFCICWCNHNPDKTSSEQDLLKVTNYWLKNYFKEPEYLKIDNKPVVIIFSPDRITKDMGVEKAKIAFEKMRELCRKEGFSGLYLAACAYPGKGTVEALKEEGYDAVTGYNYPSAGANSGEKTSPYDLAIQGYNAIWEEIAGYGLLDYIAVTDPGWDARPWHGEQAFTRTGKHPDKFKKMLELAKGFTDKHPVGKDKLNIVLAEAWNEFGEGDFIEPHREFGFGYLDAIREVFTTESKGHQDVIPQDAGLSVKQWQDISRMIAWEFNEDGNGEGWNPLMNLNDAGVAGGVLKGTSATNDSAFRSSELEINGEKFPFIVIRVKISKNSQGQIFWLTKSSQNYNEPMSFGFRIKGDGEFHEYKLNVGKNSLWLSDLITDLRFDPTGEEGVTAEVDYIRLVEK